MKTRLLKSFLLSTALTFFTQNSMAFDDLPEEVKMAILSHLPKQDLLSCRMVSRDLKRLASDRSLWEQITVVTKGANIQNGRLVHLPDFVKNLTAYGRHDLTGLTNLGSLSQLDISNTGVTDKGVKALAASPDLKVLNIGETGVTDKGVIALAAAAPNLQTLNLHDTGVTDEGVKALAANPNLKVLDIRDTRVTDKGIIALAANPNLKVLNIGDCREVTDEGVKALVNSAIKVIK